jgi:hypothetical protein
MALIECPECGTDISSRAETCPRCAYPISKKAKKRSRSGTGLPSPYSGLEVAKQLVGRILIGGFIFIGGAAPEAAPLAIIGSLVIFGSCIPIWFKARKAAALGLAADPRALDAHFKELAADMEYRQVQQLEDIADQNARQIAELEERLDFTERLLAKQADQGQKPN